MPPTASCRRCEIPSGAVSSPASATQIAHRLGKTPQASAHPAHCRDRRGGHLDTEEIGHQCGQAVLGQQLIVQKIDHEGRESRAYCPGALTPSGNSARVFAPQAAHWQSCARCSVTTRGAGSGRSNTCRTLWPTLVYRVEAHAAHRAGRRVMIDNSVGISDLSQCLAFVTLLPPGFFAGTFAQARRPRRLLQPIARRWLAAVGTVELEPALKFGEPRFRRSCSARSAAISAIRSCLGRLAWQFANHPILESKTAPAVQNLSPIQYSSQTSALQLRNRKSFALGASQRVSSLCSQCQRRMCGFR